MNDVEEAHGNRRARRQAFGRRLRRLRESRGWSCRKLADLIDADEASVRGWESGDHVPSGRFMVKLADKFGITVAALSAVQIDEPAIPVSARLVETKEELPKVLMDLLRRTTTSLKEIRIAARYATANDVQKEFRNEVSRRIIAGDLMVERAEIIYDLSRLKEVLANIFRYSGCRYHVKAYCPGLDEVVPGIGGYCFDDREFLLGGYWERTPPPPDAVGLQLSGDPCREFFRAYWGEIWRRGTWLNEKGESGLDPVFHIAKRLGLKERNWRRFVDEARHLVMGDGAPPLF